MRYLDIFPLLREHGIKPKKSLGQNFLIESAGLEKVVKAAPLSPETNVLEIGAGLGSLTWLLAQEAARVTAVEIDKTFIPILSELFKDNPKVRIVHGDILKLDPRMLMPCTQYVVVANIPYYISSAIMRHLLEAEHKPKAMVLTVQKEVAQRICAPAGKLSLLALSVQVFGKPKISGFIPANSFYPAPEVDSAVLQVELYPHPLIPLESLDLFFKLAHAGFGQKRKTLRNSLSAGLEWPSIKSEALLKQAGIAAQRRAESLSLEEWQALILAFQAFQ
jgi:16S rRNA (adenine1518-N6/adenine1519-N6)-dimethyltransferase